MYREYTTDSELGRWTFGDWRPDAGTPLDGLIERVWYFDGSTLHAHERVFPNGVVEIIVSLGATYHVLENTGRATSPLVGIAGIRTTPLIVESPAGRSRVLGIRLHPVGAHAFLRGPVSELTECDLALDEVLAGAALELADRCANGRTAQDRVREAVEWVGERIRRTPPKRWAHPGIAWAARRIRAAAGTDRIDRLRDESGLSRSRFHQAFTEQVGVPAKRYARIHRFQHALRLLQGNRFGLTDVALRAGYYDQPHMNADFREFAGMTPLAFVHAIHYPETTSVAETPR